jgi:hypothetical protein
MADPKDDGLGFIRAIKIEQFWRAQLGDTGYSAYDPADLRRWYEAMDMRGPEEIGAFVVERAGRYPAGPVTGIVTAAPHPPAFVVDLWLRSQDRVHTGSVWLGMAAFLLFALLTANWLSGFGAYKWPNFANNIPQPATLVTGQLYGAPTAAATAPQYAPGQPYAYANFGANVQGYQPTAPGLAAQAGTAFQTQVGVSQIGAPAASAGASASSSALNGPGRNTLGASLGIASPGPSAYQPGSVASAGMHTMNTGNSNIPSGQGGNATH